MDFNTIMSSVSSNASTSNNMSSGQNVKPGEIDFLAALEKLKEEATKTPEQRARDGVLKKHDMSEQDYQRLPSDKRAGIDAEIASAIRRVAEQRRANMAARNGALA